ncbi:MAG: radical SAM/SPASM domain-containing protein [Chloroflexota bacterium]|nr:radical SAM protein [Anaerolineales bacterium]
MTEDELADWRVKATDDSSLVYYAVREWDSRQLAQGCYSSPIRVYLEVTQSCNLTCAMCYRSAGKAVRGEFGTEEMLHLIGNLAAIGAHELRVTGGEPTTRADILQLIDAAVSAGLYVSLGTNGVWSDEMTAALLSRRVGRYLVSLEGVKEVNDLLRGPGAYEATISTIDNLIAAGKQVRVNTMLSRATLEHLRETVALCAAHKLKHMSLIPPRPAGRAVGRTFSAEMPGPREMELAARLLAPLYQEYGVTIEYEYNIYQPAACGQSSDPVLNKIVSCPAGREAAFISPTGWLYACGCSPGGSSRASERAPFAAANVRQLDAAEIWKVWQRSAVWQPFRDLRQSKDPACFRCNHYGRGCFGSCPVHAFLAGGAFNAPDPLCWVRAEISSTDERRSSE